MYHIAFHHGKHNQFGNSYAFRFGIFGQPRKRQMALNAERHQVSGCEENYSNSLSNFRKEPFFTLNTCLLPRPGKVTPSNAPLLIQRRTVASSTRYRRAISWTVSKSSSSDRCITTPFYYTTHTWVAIHEQMNVRRLLPTWGKDKCILQIVPGWCSCGVSIQVGEKHDNTGCHW